MTKFRRTIKGRPKPKFQRQPRLPSLQSDQLDSRTTTAIAYARAKLRDIRDSKVGFLGEPALWFSPDDQRRHAIEILKRVAADPQGLLTTYHFATVGRWKLAYDAMCELNVEFEHHKQPKPPPLATFSEELSLQAKGLSPRPRFGGGPEKASHFLRDLALVTLVGDVCWKFGFKATRDPACPHHPSGCSIVAQAASEEHMPLTEDIILHAWRKYGRIAWPDAKFTPETYPSSIT